MLSTVRKTSQSDDPILSQLPNNKADGEHTVRARYPPSSYSDPSVIASAHVGVVLNLAWYVTRLASTLSLTMLVDWTLRL